MNSRIKQVYNNSTIVEDNDPDYIKDVAMINDHDLDLSVTSINKLDEAQQVFLSAFRSDVIINRLLPANSTFIKLMIDDFDTAMLKMQRIQESKAKIARHVLVVAMIMNFTKAKVFLYEKTISTYSNLVSYLAIKDDPFSYNVINTLKIKSPSEFLRFMAVEKDANSVSQFKSPSMPVELLAINKDPKSVHVMQYSPSEDVTDTAAIFAAMNGEIREDIKNIPTAIQVIMILQDVNNIKKMKCPCRFVQTYAVMQDPLLYEFIEMPYAELFNVRQFMMVEKGLLVEETNPEKDKLYELMKETNNELAIVQEKIAMVQKDILNNKATPEQIDLINLLNDEYRDLYVEHKRQICVLKSMSN